MGNKVLVLIPVMIVSIILAVGAAFATPKDKNVVFEIKGTNLPKDIAQTKAIFDGKVHAEKELKCNECHTKLFPMKRSPVGTYTMEKMNKGESCGTCHNGEKDKAFKTSDPANCVKCHKKPEK